MSSSSSVPYMEPPIPLQWSAESLDRLPFDLEDPDSGMTQDVLNQAGMQPTVFDNIIDKIEGSEYKDEQAFKNVKLIMEAFKTGDDATKASACKDDFVDVSKNLKGVLNDFELRVMSNITGDLDAPEEVKTACKAFNEKFLVDCETFGPSSDSDSLRRNKMLNFLKQSIGKLSQHSMYRDFDLIPTHLYTLRTVVTERQGRNPEVLQLATTIGDHFVKIHFRQLRKEASEKAQKLRSDSTYLRWSRDPDVPGKLRQETDYQLSKVMRHTWSIDDKDAMKQRLSTLSQWDGEFYTNKGSLRYKINNLNNSLDALGKIVARLGGRTT